MNVTPHVAQNLSGRRSAIDGRLTRHAGYAMSQRMDPQADRGAELFQQPALMFAVADLPHFAGPSALRYGDADARFVNVQSDVCDIVHQARPPCMRLCAGHPAESSTLCMKRTGRRLLSEHRDPFAAFEQPPA